jgi:hypothetical protein
MFLFFTNHPQGESWTSKTNIVGVMPVLFESDTQTEKKKKTWEILNRPEVKHVMLLWRYKEKQFVVDTRFRQRQTSMPPTVLFLFSLCTLSVLLCPDCSGFAFCPYCTTRNINIHAPGGIQTRNPSQRSAARPPESAAIKLLLHVAHRLVLNW